ncbi:MAG: thiamine phosphate synthase [Desulfobacteraceae bacterium]|jgi:thiamine-phosphate pyrophosphorylase
MAAEAATRRAIDANLNRVGEGLRVAEDILRYCLEDGPLQARVKALRHRLAAAAPAESCVGSRRPKEDVGFDAPGELEYQRPDLQAALRANFKRAQEGLRSLEELFKLWEGQTAAEMKRLRYEVYEAERLTLLRFCAKPLPRGLYLVLTEPRDGYAKLTEWALQAELPAVQLRYKGKDDRQFLSVALAMRRITAGSQTRFIVNDRPDIALLADADGVHLGQQDLPPRAVRRLIGPGKLLGLSTHNLHQVHAAADEPVDYIGFGPLFGTPSKADPDPVVGPGQLGAAAAVSRHPIVAIGGLTAARIAALDLGGCRNVAVISAVSQAENPLAAMTAINRLVREAA